MTFEEIIPKILEAEGGYSNDSTDRGGETNFGISKNANKDIDIKGITEQEAIEIYRNKYWIPSKAEHLPSELRHQYFDMVVNHGQTGAVRILQQAMDGVKVDGIIGNKTLMASHGLDAGPTLKRKKHLN